MNKIMLNPANKGALHRALHVKQGAQIPMPMLEKAKASGNPHLAQMANFAINARGFKRK
ncbi:MAG TPA: hypothetical protein VMV33_00500 [Rhodocyclaceae bacterium]|nr:hypothetical protein [Rhodocyclaceae bacterium]